MRTKEEIKEYQTRYKRTPEGVVTVIFHSQKYSSVHRNHPKPDYTKKELIEWSLKDERFIFFYNLWVASNFNHKIKPSIDRLDDYLPYTFDNIRWTTWYYNNMRSHEDVKNGINNKKSKPIYKLDLNGNLIK